MSRESPDVRYALLAGMVLAIAIAGFSSFLYYLQLDVVAFAGSGLLILAIAAGAASFFSPCSFPLLVTLLARESGVDEADRHRPGRALRFAAALSVGVTIFLLLTGIAIAAGSGPLFQRITFASLTGRILRTAVGLLLIVLGWIQIKGVRFDVADRLKRPLMNAQARLRRGHPNLGFGLFGFGYVLAGFG